MLIFGDRHLRSILAEHEAHYNGRRPHRSRQLRPPRPGHPIAGLSQERIKRRPVLGGLLNEYERAAQKPWSKTVAEFWHPTGRTEHFWDTKVRLLSGHGRPGRPGRPSSCQPRPRFRLKTRKASGRLPGGPGRGRRQDATSLTEHGCGSPFFAGRAVARAGAATPMARADGTDGNNEQIFDGRSCGAIRPRWCAGRNALDAAPVCEQKVVVVVQFWNLTGRDAPHRSLGPPSKPATCSWTPAIVVTAPEFPIHDRDSRLTTASDAVFTCACGCLVLLLILGEQHLRRS